MRLTQSFHLPERKICRCAASCPRNAVWVNRNANQTAMNICHHESPIQMNTPIETMNATGIRVSFVQ